ncbi:MAG: hypothetical protein Q9218_005880 [Villophora microphyllina]
MGTRGYKAWRFRKRYYHQYNHWDSYPEGLGKDIVKTIPIDPQEYATWLEDQRKMVEAWEAAWNKLLAQPPPDGTETTVPAFMVEYHPNFIAPLNDVYIEWVYIIDLDREIFSVSNGAHFKLDQISHIDWIAALAIGQLGDQIVLPALLPEAAIASVMAEVPARQHENASENMVAGQDVTADLQPGSAVSRAMVEQPAAGQDVIAAGDKLDGFEVAAGKVVPAGQHGASKEDMIAGHDVIADLGRLTIEKGKARELPRRDVTSKDVDAIEWRQRHGPVLRSVFLWLWSRQFEKGLTATLLQWTPDDFAFREIAFAALCLAAGGEHITAMPDKRFINNGVFGHVKPEFQEGYATGFFSNLAVGAHYEGRPAGTAPKETIYWLDDVLVFLTTQLYRAGAVDEEISRVVKHCQEHYPNDIVDAVLISIEHAVILHIIPDSEVQHTGLLPLLNIENHCTMDVRDRYSSSYLNKLAGKDEALLQKQKKWHIQAMDAENARDGIVIHRGKDSDDEEEEPEGEVEEEQYVLYRSHISVEEQSSDFSTFYALMHLFEAAATRRLPPTKPRDGRLPNELYSKILYHITDVPTRSACMRVSRLFRRLCQEDLLFTDGIILPPCTSLQRVDLPDKIPTWFEMQDLDAGTWVNVEFKKAGGFLDSYDPAWMVAVGTGRNTKSLLTGLKFRLPEVK